MKIYTKTGDRGLTSMIGGNLVPKDHPRIEAYGTLDELISWIGLLRDQGMDEHDLNVLISIQDKLMRGAALLASPDDSNAEGLPELCDEDIHCLEAEIDRLDEGLKPLTSFLLPGGHTSVSHCHIARSVCRRAERQMLQFTKGSAQIQMLFVFTNRLSDYLFTLARKMSLKLKVEELPWKPEK